MSKGKNRNRFFRGDKILFNYFLFFVVFLSVSVSCCNWEPNKKEDKELEKLRHELLINESLSDEVLVQLPKYKLLQEFLVNNYDTLIRHNQSNSVKSFKLLDGQIKQFKKLGNCVYYYTANTILIDDYTPQNLKSELNILISNIDQKIMRDFTICLPNNNSESIDQNLPTISFNIYGIDQIENPEIEIFHTLNWNLESKETLNCPDKYCDLVKNQDLGDNWIYSIKVLRHTGW